MYDRFFLRFARIVYKLKFESSYGRLFVDNQLGLVVFRPEVHFPGIPEFRNQIWGFRLFRKSRRSFLARCRRLVANLRLPSRLKWEQGTGDGISPSLQTSGVVRLSFPPGSRTTKFARVLLVSSVKRSGCGGARVRAIRTLRMLNGHVTSVRVTRTMAGGEFTRVRPCGSLRPGGSNSGEGRRARTGVHACPFGIYGGGSTPTPPGAIRNTRGSSVGTNRIRYEKARGQAPNPSTLRRAFPIDPRRRPPTTTTTTPVVRLG